MHALEDEPEKGHRLAILLAGGVLAAVLQGGGLYAASKYEAPPKKKSERIEVAIVQKKPPPPPPPPKEELVEPPKPPEPPKPEPPKPKPRVEKPKPPPEPPKPEPPPPEPPKPPPPLVTGLTLESTVQGSKGPVVQIGNSMMGEMATTAVAPVTRPGVKGGTGDGPIVAEKPVAAVRTQARRLNEVKPRYPEMARTQGIEGVVKLLLTIDAEGRVIDVKVIKGLGFGLDEAAIAAARQLRFEPARLDGQGVESKLSLPMRFTLEDY